MKTTFFNHPRVRQVLTVLLLSGALCCIFPPARPEFQWWAQQSFYVAMGFVALGLLFLLGNNSRLMFVCLGCGAAISFHYHEKTERIERLEQVGQAKNWNIPLPWPNPRPGDISPFEINHEPASPHQ